MSKAKQVSKKQLLNMSVEDFRDVMVTHETSVGMATKSPALVKTGEGDSATWKFQGLNGDFANWTDKQRDRIYDAVAYDDVQLDVVKTNLSQRKAAIGDMLLAAFTSLYLDSELAAIEDPNERAKAIKALVDSGYDRCQSRIVNARKVVLGESRDVASSAVSMTRGFFSHCNVIARHDYDALVGLLDFNRRGVINRADSDGKTKTSLSKNRMSFTGRKSVAAKMVQDIIVGLDPDHQTLIDDVISAESAATSAKNLRNGSADVWIKEWVLAKANPSADSVKDSEVKVSPQMVSMAGIN
jgi:hypothetical protein